jgi:3-isopropylmalate dehydrogenase
VAFDLARKRRGKVTSVDKSNVMASSQLWREVAIGMGERNPDVELEHLFVDAAAMYLVKSPTWFDVMVTTNSFGDILSDEASMLAGSLGMLPSASLGAGKLGVYEPSHGSAPRHAGKDEANPIATILSGAFLLRYSLDLDGEAKAVEDALARVLDKGFRTYDIMSTGDQKVGTRKMGELISQEVLEG